MNDQVATSGLRTGEDIIGNFKLKGLWGSQEGGWNLGVDGAGVWGRCTGQASPSGLGLRGHGVKDYRLMPYLWKYFRNTKGVPWSILSTPPTTVFTASQWCWLVKVSETCSSLSKKILKKLYSKLVFKDSFRFTQKLSRKHRVPMYLLSLLFSIFLIINILCWCDTLVTNDEPTLVIIIN